MLDFNSLYPSIIQEYNICFSTVQRPADGSMPPLPQPPVPGSMAPLPTILQGLVRKRKQAKSAMASARDPVMKNQLNIRQQAIKLTANSMYGCLGFSASRFFARPLAELITSQGRSILQATVDLVQGTIGAEVIYGDTDSIMIYTGSDDLMAVRELGARIKREVNRRYKLLEIELDGIFKCMLLLKKKKYACIKLEPGPNNTVVEVQEQKGLDIVRRDWCPLSKDLGHAALAAILSGRPREEVVEAIHDSLREVRGRLAADAVPLGKFIITKALTKRLEEYPDARSQPHVQVALRRRAAGKRDGVQA
ncbi:DNA polymerase, partial [Haematococcus lacustris]